MREEVRFPRKGMKKITKMCSQAVIALIDDYHKDPTYFKNVKELINEVVDDLLYGDGQMANSSELFECPVKTAKEFFGQINENTIKQAWDAIPHNCGPRDRDLRICEYLGYAQYVYYLSNKCGYCKSLMTKKSITGVDVIKLASLVQTLDLPKQVYLDYLDYMDSHFDTVRFFDKEKLWEEAKKAPKGMICKNFCKQEKCFEDFDAPEKSIEGNKPCA